MLFLIKSSKLGKPVLMEVDGLLQVPQRIWLLLQISVWQRIRLNLSKPLLALVWLQMQGGIHLLSRSIGVTRAAQLAMTGEALYCRKALEWGLVYRVCEADKLEKTREQLLKKLRRGSSNSLCSHQEVGFGRVNLKTGRIMPLLELNLQESLAQTEDFKEGVRAHSERRRPKFYWKIRKYLHCSLKFDIIFCQMF